MKISTNKCRYCGQNFPSKLGLDFHQCVVEVPTAVRQALENIWFTFGNGGLKHTQDNHKFIQRLIGRAQQGSSILQANKGVQRSRGQVWSNPMSNQQTFKRGQKLLVNIGRLFNTGHDFYVPGILCGRHPVNGTSTFDWIVDFDFPLTAPHLLPQCGYDFDTMVVPHRFIVDAHATLTMPLWANEKALKALETALKGK